MGKTIEFKTYRVGVGQDYTTLATLEDVTLDEKGPVVGVISREQGLISQLKDYLKRRFYDGNTEHLYLFSDSGLVLAYHDNSEWVEVQGGLEEAFRLPFLKANVLHEVIAEYLQRILGGEGKDEREAVVDVILKATFNELADLISRDKRYLDHIEWRDLERTLGVALEKIGFKVTVTPPSRDGGKDIIASLEVCNETYSFIIEVKHWRCGKRVGPGPVEKFLRVIINERRAGGLFLASHGFTEDCIEAVASLKRYPIKLGDESTIWSIFKMYTRKKEGLMLPASELVRLLSTGLDEKAPDDINGE
jgi:hypothetical protein